VILRKFCVLCFLLALAAALELKGPQELVRLPRGGSAKHSVILNNPTDQPEKITVSYYLERYPDGDRQSDYRQMLDSIQQKTELRLEPNSFQEYAWTIQTDDYTALGKYLFWVVFTRDTYSQSNEESVFVAQEANYFPLRVECLAPEANKQ
jgi:hypothetical protein